jgi:hypothetical protein
MNATCRPSGDQTGSDAENIPELKAMGSVVPSAFTTNTCEVGGAADEWYASCVPSGDQAATWPGTISPTSDATVKRVPLRTSRTTRSEPVSPMT